MPETIIEGDWLETRNGWKIHVTRVEWYGAIAGFARDVGLVYGIFENNGTDREEYVGTVGGLLGNLKR